VAGGRGVALFLEVDVDGQWFILVSLIARHLTSRKRLFVGL